MRISDWSSDVCSSDLTAPASGHVTEITVAEGGLIREGQSLLTFQTGGSGLELLLYIPPQHGKKVQAGTPVQIAPSTAKREEFGTLIGTVKSISRSEEHKSELQSLMRISYAVFCLKKKQKQ